MLNSLTNSMTQPFPTKAQVQLGDVIQGKLMNIKSDGMAIVLVNGENIEAKLQAPLEQGKTYIFQIQSMENELLLKVIPTASSKATEVVEKILSQFSLPKGGWEQQLVQLAVNHGWKLENSNKLELSLQWLSASQSKDSDLQVIEFISRNSLPFTREIFQSLSAVFSRKDLSTMIQALQGVSAANYSNPIKEIDIPVEQRVGYRVVATALAAPIHSLDFETSRQFLTQYIQTTNPTLPISNEKWLPIERLAEITIDQSTFQQWKKGEEAFIRGNRQEAFTIWRQILPNVTTTMTNDEVLGLLLQELFFTGKASHVKIEALDHFFKQVLLALEDRSFLASLGKHIMVLPESENLSRFVQGEQTSQTALIRTIITAELKDIFKSLGVNLEAELLKGTPEGLDESIKANLLRLLQQEHVPQKQTIQELLVHIQGQKLLNQELGPIIHLFTQVPLPFLHRLKDAEISWSGRKTKDGKIDPHHCRVLFHLHLEKFGETLLDLQVQNRIVSLHIFHRLENFQQPPKGTIDALKSGLSQLGYQVSSFQFIYVSDEERETTFAPIYTQFQSFSKVDVRI